MTTKPDFDTFKKLTRKANLIAVTRELPADLDTPVSTFLKLGTEETHAFLLESAEQADSIGRYSIIGLKPKLLIKHHRGKITIKPQKGRATTQNSKLIQTLESELKKYKLANIKDVPGFPGGLVGYIGYECVQEFEKISLQKKSNLGIPDSIFYLTEEMVIFDHYRKSLNIVVLADISDTQHSATYKAAKRRIDKIANKLRLPLVLKKHQKKTSAIKIKSNMTQKKYESLVNKAKSYIRAGDCIQTVLSQRFEISGKTDEFLVYRALRSLNPSPYMFYFKSKNTCLIGSSPELLVKKTGRRAETRPIAGTRPRGRTEKEDKKFAESLKKSKKEMAEHLMLVDLGRNDLGRVCQFESVKVEDFARIENYSHVMHLVSDVAGTLKPTCTAFDLLKASFPAGTLSGAPKVRAMEIIDELEPTERGPYGGCVGYFGFNGDMDTCITIRTLTVHNGKTYLQAGAGIVKDSNPKKEYEETQNKAKALFKALREQDNFL